MYPGRPASQRKHRLGLDDGYSLSYLDDDGEWRTGRPDDYESYVTTCLLNRLDVRIESILAFRWLEQAVKDPTAIVYATQTKVDHHAKPVSIVWRRGNKWASLFSASSWGDGATQRSVERHRRLNDWLTPGAVYASPSSLGQATIRAKLDRWYTTLGTSETRDLMQNIVGGRAETYQPGNYAESYEIDRRMAYVAEAARWELPTGAAGFVGDIGLEAMTAYPQWYGRCAVVIPSPLVLGPFPFRQQSGRLSFPTAPGHYKAWLWKAEVEDMCACGCLVYPELAWTWQRSEPVLIPWGEWIYERRIHAPDDLDDLVKKVAVAGLGWFAMPAYRLRVQIGRDESENERVIVNGSGYPTRYVAVEEVDRQPRQMPHWISFIWMQARRSLYARQLAELESGNSVLASDFDSLLLAIPSRLNLSSDLGQWREQRHTGVQLTVARHLISDQKIKQPGVKRAR